MNASQMWDSQLVANLIAPYLDANGITHVSASCSSQDFAMRLVALCSFNASHPDRGRSEPRSLMNAGFV